MVWNMLRLNIALFHIFPIFSGEASLGSFKYLSLSPAYLHTLGAYSMLSLFRQSFDLHACGRRLRNFICERDSGFEIKWKLGRQKDAANE